MGSKRTVALFGPLITAAAAVVLLLLVVAAPLQALSLNNVILIISDDLSPFYLDKDHPMKMPRVLELASRGTNFVNAFSTFPVCGPSRMSFMTGRYADSTKLFTFERHVPQVPGLGTMAQYLATRHGYETVAWGKIFHDDYTPSNPIAAGMFQARMWTRPQFGGGSSDADCRMKWFCTKPLERTGDFQLGRRFTRWLAARNASRPFFAALGFRKPHLDVGIPPSFAGANQFPGRDEVLTNEPPSLGRNNTVIPFRKSLQCFDCYYEIAQRKVEGLTAYPPQKFLVPAQSKRLANMRRYYFAAANFVDSNIGFVVDYLNQSEAYANNTAIVFISDHGFAHGEHGIFCKNALFDQQTRVSFVATPARQTTGVDRGRVRLDPVDLTNVFPTVIHLATGDDLAWKAQVDASGIPLDGKSVIQASRPVLAIYAFSQYPRCDLISRKANWQCVIGVTPCSRIRNKFMGYAVRTTTTRYVEWRRFSDVFTRCQVPTWPGLATATRRRMKRVFQINANATGTVWTDLPFQREMFDDFPDSVDFQWGQWERENALVSRIGNTSDIVSALELSSAIRWRFDPSFTGGAPGQPCSGNGYVRLRNVTQWNSFNAQPSRADVKCECLSGFSGEECQTQE